MTARVSPSEARGPGSGVKPRSAALRRRARVRAWAYRTRKRGLLSRWARCSSPMRGWSCGAGWRRAQRAASRPRGWGRRGRGRGGGGVGAGAEGDVGGEAEVGHPGGVGRLCAVQPGPGPPCDRSTRATESMRTRARTSGAAWSAGARPARSSVCPYRGPARRMSRTRRARRASAPPGEGDVEKPGPGDDDVVDPVGTEKSGPQQLGDGGRGLPGRAGELEGDVGGVVTAASGPGGATTTRSGSTATASSPSSTARRTACSTVRESSTGSRDKRRRGGGWVGEQVRGLSRDVDGRGQLGVPGGGLGVSGSPHPPGRGIDERLHDSHELLRIEGLGKEGVDADVEPALDLVLGAGGDDEEGTPAVRGRTAAARRFSAHRAGA